MNVPDPARDCLRQYQNDPHFRTLVDTFVVLLSGPQPALNADDVINALALARVMVSRLESGRRG